MPDITVSFTDAQWTRIVAASSHIKMATRESGDVDAAYLIKIWKDEIALQVKQYEESRVTADEF
jgi:hypothetical protein|tara:strand:+ start:524 stop:715 length:192 start_codon:yes stop_codon:yes gene_type:complete